MKQNEMVVGYNDFQGKYSKYCKPQKMKRGVEKIVHEAEFNTWKDLSSITTEASKHAIEERHNAAQ